MTDDDNLIDPEGNVDEDELDRRVRELGLDQPPSIAEEAKLKADKIDDEFSERLRALENKARTHKIIRDNQAKETDRKMRSDAQSAKGLGVGLSVAYTIIGLPLAGVAIGWLIDQRMGTQTYRSIGVLLGSVLGIAAALAILSRANRSE
jgi:F0F1-type ATP synthase assembly protein I